MFNSEDIQSSLNLKSQVTDYETANYPPEHDCNSFSPSFHPSLTLPPLQLLLQEALVPQRTPGPHQPSEESISPLISQKFPKILPPPSTPQTLTAPHILSPHQTLPVFP